MKKLLKIVGVILVLLVIAALVAPMFISAELLKKELIAQASQATGRPIAINGKTSLKLFPTIEVSAQDVTIGNPAGFASPYLLHAKTLATGAALMPLLHGALNVTGITIDGADVRLEQAAGGAQNWSFTQQKVQEKAAQSAQKNAGDSSASALKSFALGDISIKDSAVTYTAPGKTYALDQINMTVSGADARSPLKVDASARYKGQTVKYKATVQDVSDFLAGKSSAASDELTLPGGHVSFSGTGSIGSTVTAKGTLDIELADVPGLIAWATGGKAPTHTPKSVTLKSAASVNGNHYSLTGASLTADSVSATGNLTADFGGAVPAVSGNLTFGNLDIDALLKTAQAAPAHHALDAYAAETSGWSTAPLDLSALKSVNADLQLAASSMKVDKMTVGATSLHVVLNGGALNVAIEKAALYGGNASGTVSATSANAIGADLVIDKVQIEPLMTALNGSSRLKGTATVKLNVRGAGASERAIVASLNGNGSLNVADGAIKGVNLAQFWREAKQGFLFGSSQQATDFTALTGTYTIASGMLSNNDLSMMSPALRMSGKGTVNLPNETIDYRLTPSIVETSQGQGGKAKTGFDIPLDIRGPLANPSVIPDVASLVKQAPQAIESLKGKVNSNTVKNVLGSGSKGVGNLLKSLGAH